MVDNPQQVERRLVTGRLDVDHDFVRPALDFLLTCCLDVTIRKKICSFVTALSPFCMVGLEPLAAAISRRRLHKP